MMLERIQSQNVNQEPLKLLSDAVGEDPSHWFIDALIEQIKHTHKEEVWNAQLQNLVQVVDLGKSKHLRAL